MGAVLAALMLGIGVIFVVAVFLMIVGPILALLWMIHPVVAVIVALLILGGIAGALS